MLRFLRCNGIWFIKYSKISLDCLTLTENNVENWTHSHQISLIWGNFFECGHTAFGVSQVVKDVAHFQNPGDGPLVVSKICQYQNLHTYRTSDVLQIGPYRLVRYRPNFVVSPFRFKPTSLNNYYKLRRHKSFQGESLQWLLWQKYSGEFQCEWFNGALLYIKWLNELQSDLVYPDSSRSGPKFPESQYAFHI